MRAATTTALLIPPGTTEVGTEVHDWVVSVEATETLWKAEPVPALFDLYVSPAVNQAIQQL